MDGLDLFKTARYHAKRAIDLRRVAAGRSPTLRRVMQGHAREHETMVRAYASIAVIEACEERHAELQGVLAQ